jgi:hypothetical protein
VRQNVGQFGYRIPTLPRQETYTLPQSVRGLSGGLSALRYSSSLPCFALAQGKARRCFRGESSVTEMLGIQALVRIFPDPIHSLFIV